MILSDVDEDTDTADGENDDTSEDTDEDGNAITGDETDYDTNTDACRSQYRRGL